MTRDQLIRETRTRAGSLPGFLVVYAVILGTMVLCAQAMV